MRIGTWNVEHAAIAKNVSRLALLSAADADIWILTETRDSLDLTPTHHAVHSAPRPDSSTGERWVSLWSRASILFRERLAVHDPTRTVCALYDAPCGPLIIYGTVMPWHADYGIDGTAKGWTEQYRVIPEQAAEWRALQSQHPRASLCVAGDFNMNLGGPHYYGTKRGRDLLAHALDAASLACVTRTEHVPPGLLQHPNIDHIAVPAAWASRSRVVTAWPGTIDGVHLSDHSAVVVEVTDDQAV